MPPKKQVLDLPVVGIIDLNDEAPMKQKKTKKVKEVMEVVVEMPVVEVVQEKPKKARKVKSPVPEELELNRNYETVDYSQPAKATKKSNPWIDHIKKFSVDNGLTYNKSMLDPRLKESYVKSTGSKGKVSLG
jgi:hypothetical protein